MSPTAKSAGLWHYRRLGAEYPADAGGSNKYRPRPPGETFSVPESSYELNSTKYKQITPESIY